MVLVSKRKPSVIDLQSSDAEPGVGKHSGRVTIVRAMNPSPHMTKQVDCWCGGKAVGGQPALTPRPNTPTFFVFFSELAQLQVRYLFYEGICGTAPGRA